MVGLNNAGLMRSELLELFLKKLGFLVCDGLLVQDQNIGDIVVVDLVHLCQWFEELFGQELMNKLTFSFKSLRT